MYASLLRFSLIAVLALGLTACDTNDVEIDPIPDPDPIGTLAAGTADLSTLTAALQAADLVDALNGPGPFTVFAPVNSAFDDLGADVVSRLLESGNADILNKVLTYHVVPGRITAADISDGQMATTLQGDRVEFDVDGSSVTIDGVSIIQTDILAGNGIVHLIDGVLTTPLDIVDTATIQGFDNLVAAVAAANLVDALRGEGPLTVFAPTNQAFEDAAAALNLTLAEVLALENLDDILLYHVVNGAVPSTALSEGQVVTTLNGATFTVKLDGGPAIDTDGDGTNDASISQTDITVKNGIIHVLDAVLLPPTTN